MNHRLRTIFSQSLDIPEDAVVDDLQYSVCPEWDSVAHMTLIAAIEEALGIMIDAEDVIDMSSFAKAKQIVAKYRS